MQAARFLASFVRPAARPTGLAAGARFVEPARVVLPPVPTHLPERTVIPATLRVMGFPFQQPTVPTSIQVERSRFFGDWKESIYTAFEALNRNARKPKKANHGKRPCSNVNRKQKRRTFGKKNH